MRIICISDTHCNHDEITVPEGDVLVHAGDSCVRGTLEELKSFGEWLVDLPHARKVIVLGNHDIRGDRLDGRRYLDTLTDRGVDVLNGTSTDVGGLKVWGTPHSRSLHGPASSDWAFGHRDGKDQYFQAIPEDVDILVTHGPAYGVLDRCVVARYFGKPVQGPVGSVDLRKTINKTKPRLHIHGHIHECSGHKDSVLSCGHRILTVNAAIMDEAYNVSHLPKTVDFIPTREGTHFKVRE